MDRSGTVSPNRPGTLFYIYFFINTWTDPEHFFIKKSHNYKKKFLQLKKNSHNHEKNSYNYKKSHNYKKNLTTINKHFTI